MTWDTSFSEYELTLAAQESVWITLDAKPPGIVEITGVQPINPQVYSGEKIDVIVTVGNLGQSAITKTRLNVDSTAISNIFVIPLDILALEPIASVDFYIRISPNIGLTPWRLHH